MKFVTRLSVLALALYVAGTLALGSGQAPVLAEEKKEPDAKALERTRDSVKMLDDLYKTSVVTITNKYVGQQADVPAAVVAKEVFAAMHKKGWHSARLVDATGKPKNGDNLPGTDFEKKAVTEIKGGKAYYEEIATVEGKPVLRAGTVVPAVLKQCTVCHGGKEGRLLGVIVYELPIK